MSIKFTSRPKLILLITLIGFFSLFIILAFRHSGADDSIKTTKELSAAFSAVIKKVEPAVVSVRARYRMVSEITFAETPKDSSSEERSYQDQLPRRANYGVGSGFIVDKSGYIITNFHVVEDAVRVMVGLENGEEYQASIVGVDEETDIAVLKIDANKELPTIAFGDSDAVQLGEWVLAIGSPFGLEQSATAGIISQVQRETPFSSPFQRFIQTDAAVNRGNSGGPLVNMDGEVIGVNSQIATVTGNFSGVSFALPAKEALFVYRQIVQYGRVRRGYLGVNLDSVRNEFAKVYGLDEAKGAIITNIADKQSPAGRAGLQVGDVITEFNGEKVQNAHDLIIKVALAGPDRDVNIVFLRENGDSLERKVVNLKLGERPTNKTITESNMPKKTDSSSFGLVLVDLNPSLAKSYNLEGEKGVLVKDIDPSSFLNDLRYSTNSDLIMRGDLIQRINRKQVSDVKSFNQIAGELKPGDPVVLHVASYNRRTQSVQKRIVQFTMR
ncbi:MAG: PDZ domain-containing protein [Acidobacteria bacterium]|nr:MAG: PDZ domain-containing protein [Acidobacteriota bacterium]